MQSQERDFRKLITKHALASPVYEVTPVESGGTVSGIPDSYWSHTKSSMAGWLELKVTDGWTVDLRPHQIGWLTRHSRRGILCRLAVRQTGVVRGVKRDVFWAFDGAYAGLLKEHGLKEAGGYALCKLEGGPRKWDWNTVKLLFAG